MIDVSNDANSLRIAGFGACMISGYPHEGGGLLEAACGIVEHSLRRPVRSTTLSLSGFPAPRAAKYLTKKVLTSKPHVVVLQFGSTDAQCPIKKKNRSGDNSSSILKSGSNARSSEPMRLYHARPSSILSSLRWEAAAVIGRVQRLDPVTPLPDYVAAIHRMIEECRTAGAIPVVLSPFVVGSRYAMKFAAEYAEELSRLYSNAEGVLFLNCVNLLKNLSKTSVLQHDGFHLSSLAQKCVGESIGHMIVGAIREKDMLKRANASTSEFSVS